MVRLAAASARTTAAADPRSHPSEITPPEVYFNRRRSCAARCLRVGATGAGLLYRRWNGVELAMMITAGIDGVVTAPAVSDASDFRVNETPTPLESMLRETGERAQLALRQQLVVAAALSDLAEDVDGPASRQPTSP